MGERDRTVVPGDPTEDVLEPGLGELSEEYFESLDFAESVTEKALKAAKRRRAEERAAADSTGPAGTRAVAREATAACAARAARDQG